MSAVVHGAVLRPGPDPTYADGDDSTWTTVDWPSLTRTELVLGRRVRVIDTGPADATASPPLLFIHGLGGLWQNWLLNIPAFMGTHRCIAPDLPGFGASEPPRDKISIKGYARAIDALCRELGVDRVTIVGNSMGGFTGAEVALEFATRVERLVLVSAAGLSAEVARREPVLAVARVLAMSSTRAGAYNRSVITRPRIRRAALQGVMRYPERLSAPLVYEQLQGSGRPGFVDALDALISYSFRDRLASIEVPVLVVWGENDMLVPVADAQRFVDLIGTNARKVVFEDTGHVAMLERPSRFNALLREFLAGDVTPESEVAGVHG